MVHKVRVYASSCPYCGRAISKEYHAKGRWGMKFGRCPSCRKIFKTGKILFSDMSYSEQQETKKEFWKILGIFFSIFAVLVAIAVIFQIEEPGVFAFIPCFMMIYMSIDHFKDTRKTLSKYSYLKRRDPELYELEYQESQRIINERDLKELERIRKSIQTQSPSGVVTNLGTTNNNVHICLSDPNEDDHKYMRYSGTTGNDIKLEKPKETPKSNDNSPRWKFCPMCGAEISDGAMYCSACGVLINKR